MMAAIEEMLRKIAGEGDTAELARAAQSFDGAIDSGAEGPSPASRMLAGAAAARARLLEGAPPPRDPDAIVAELDALQRRIDAGLDRAAALRSFAELGAVILAHPMPRMIDQRVDTSGEDDTVYYWASGAAALKRL